MTAKAKKGEMDPVVGRDEEIRKIIDVLMRRRQNNPILTGEAGVGKTAVVEGFAQRLADGDVPPQLKGVRLCALDIGLMQAGASMKGEFEQRLRSVIDEVQASPTPIILFIDEAHTLIGAGGAQGTGDAANLLKPALARGTLRTIGATTWAEYRQYFEKDPALTRRFQPVKVDEPVVEKCQLHAPRHPRADGKAPQGAHLDEAVVAAVNLSHATFRAAAARQGGEPARYGLRAGRHQPVDDAGGDRRPRRVIEGRRRSSGARARDRARPLRGRTHRRAEDEDRDAEAKLPPRGRAGRRGRSSTRSWRCAPSARRRKQRRPKARAPGARRRSAAEAAPRWSRRTARRCRQAQGAGSIKPNQRMIYAHVDEQAVASVVSDWTGIPVGRMVADEVQTVLQLAEILNKRVVGQSMA